jgi:hypothetical protein
MLLDANRIAEPVGLGEKRLFQRRNLGLGVPISPAMCVAA